MENHERMKRELLEQCDQVATLVKCFAWLQRCDECIERFEELCLTGAVLSSNHIEPRRFLEDAGNVVLERVRDAIERHGSVKVNRVQRCLHYFSTNERLQSHAIDCGKMNDCAIRRPSEDDKWFEFGNYSNKERVPFIVYADLECVLRNTKPEKEDASYTYQQHEVCSVGYYVRCSYHDALSSYQFHRDEDCIACENIEEMKLEDLTQSNIQSWMDACITSVRTKNCSRMQWTVGETHSMLRTDDTFKNRIHIEHHTGDSILEKLAIGMASQISLDYMHLICLGVVKRLLQL
ncbi:hypothetical protein ALC57_11934 [Trachymyrmex cornetzi]|uniref:Uncharacterized protein n=1 Tax=Trachymyrmex cornetzi TaxID=471704 RepID=A0A195DSM8_9HYME|nr:hypothetical protein ALC57_11934 [Trachymyrmex cornetzi]